MRLASTGCVYTTACQGIPETLKKNGLCGIGRPQRSIQLALSILGEINSHFAVSFRPMNSQAKPIKTIFGIFCVSGIAQAIHQLHDESRRL
jgi:hypothetical protein